MKKINTFLSQFVEVESHPAWQGNISLDQVQLLLVHQAPFTYLLSGKGPTDYYLSYIKKSSAIIHIHFGKITFKKKGIIVEGFRNVTVLNFSTLENLIRYKIKGKGILPSLRLLELSA